MNLSIKQFTVYLALLSIGTGTGWLGNRYLQAQNRTENSPAIPVVRRQLPTSTQPLVPESRVVQRSSSNFIAEAAEIVGPAVVRIDAARQPKNRSAALNNPLFKRFFGEQLPESNQRVRRGTGSGFIVAPDGRLITNAHVVDGADIVQVTLNDGRIYEGKVKGVDDLTDVAAIKIDVKDLPIAPMGHSDGIVPGQWAIAIGNPLGLDNTITVGIISATGRSSSQVGIPKKRVRFIQTDAAINPGNSGGPLLNAQGEVIGVNTAIRANAQGLGFAIPIETAVRIANQLFEKGKADHPFLGVQMVELTPKIKEEMSEQLDVKLSKDRGVLVVRVVEDSPAAKAGILKGDILQKVNNVAVNTPTHVQEEVELQAIGEELDIEINREGKAEILKLKTV
ncbi:MAG: HhoA/HhoB/HtrA family serine endopeptidase, partial [Cyanobacteriota bacterium]|nr:HhoA/HhoB/HtrA family serine endopeptidase [Cyanobacteriota bacterium]